MNFNAIYEIYYWIFNKAYYKAMIVKDMEKIKTVVQRVEDKEKGKDIALIDTKLKKAWFLMPEVCFRDTKKFLMTCDIDNAIPLVEDVKIVTDAVMKNTFVREISITRLTSSQFTLEELQRGKGNPKKFTAVYFPPQVLFEMLDGHFVKETLANPPSLWAEKKWVFIALIFGIVVIVYLLLNSGLLSGVRI